MDPFPAINKAYALVTQEERHHTIVRSRDDKTESEAMTFATQALRSTAPKAYQRASCTYCGRLGHKYEVCYQRVGYPEGGTRGRGRGRQSFRGRGGGNNGRINLTSTTANKAAAPRNDGNTTEGSNVAYTSLP
ncbi:hypothetical protein POM88_005394 [Heracleum sosnowskyi]|uniref:Gag protein n=1 Tax=Heracleum sosnowskyi TaxID=360622 RepID=A0AAD8J3D6_9APIA|nr:hypothetical protein POM88_005394 [Heracleum sosnowskyi]